ncbi:MAG: phosphodiester glycosidase family protein [Dysgonomonas sp.]
MIDLTNEYTKIEQVQSNNKVPDLVRETTLAQSRRNTYDGHRVYCAVNHDFFVYELGINIGLNISDGEIPSRQGWGRSLLAFNKDNLASVFYPNLSANVILADNTQIPIESYNTGDPAAASVSVILLNRFNVVQMQDAGTYVKIKPEGEWTVNGPDVPCKVLEVSKTPLMSSNTEYVLVFRNARATEIEGKVNVNDRIFISQKFLKDKFGTPLENIKAGFHGYPSILYDGVLHEGEYNNFENGREYEVAPHTMLGISKDGKTAYVMVVDGRSAISKGINCVETAYYMRDMGAWYVVNFDSGGSTTLAINNELANVIPGGAQRPVMDTFQAVSIAPKSEEEASFSFIRPSISSGVGYTTQLQVLSHNQYGEILNKDVKDMTFTCYPSSLGRVDENGVFYASLLVQDGYIEAEKNGKKAKLRVSLSPLEDFNFSFENILLDNIKEAQVDALGYFNNIQYNIAPSSVSWESSNPEVCSVVDGKIKGMQNGTSVITGKFSGLEDTLTVVVEIGVDSMAMEGFTNKDDFTISKPSTITNMTLSNTELPTGWLDGLSIKFDSKQGRSPSLGVIKSIPIYGLPDSLTFQLLASDNLLNDIMFNFKTKSNQNFPYKIAGNALKNGIIPIVTNELYNSAFNVPLYDYPITLERISFTLKNTASGSGLEIALRDLRAYYPNKTGGGNSIENVVSDKYDLQILVKGSLGQLAYTLEEDAYVRIELYNLNGVKMKEIANGNKARGEHSDSFALDNIDNGVYIVVFSVDNNVQSFKLLK